MQLFQFSEIILGCGDTAFPSILRIGANKFIIANYTSPVSRCEDWSWAWSDTVLIPHPPITYRLLAVLAVVS